MKKTFLLLGIFAILSISSASAMKLVIAIIQPVNLGVVMVQLRDTGEIVSITNITGILRSGRAVEGMEVEVMVIENKRGKTYVLCHCGLPNGSGPR
ncbi:MAG: hypothetical protein IH946_04400 [Bacteroidetes bacterium]|nr:hypothetical protein [Bacteroidota bacterium]